MRAGTCAAGMMRHIRVNTSLFERAMGVRENADFFFF